MEQDKIRYARKGALFNGYVTITSAGLKIDRQKGNSDLHCEQIDWKEENSALDLV